MASSTLVRMTSDLHDYCALFHPPTIVYKTKPELAIEMLQEAVARGVRPLWVGADKIYGEVEAFRRAVAEHQLDYAVSVSKQAKVWLTRPRLESPEEFNAKIVAQGRRRTRYYPAPGEPEKVRVDEYARDLDPEQWQEYSCGQGTKGERLYQWAVVEVVENELPGRDSLLIVRQKLGDASSRAYFLAHSAHPHALQTWVERIGTRWPIEQCFEEAKNECGVDEYEVRSWQGWHRHITLSMVAQNFLAEQRSACAQEEAAKKKRRPRSSRTPADRALERCDG